MRVRETLREWSAAIVSKVEKYMAGDDVQMVETEPEPDSTAVLGQDDVRAIHAYVFVNICVCMWVCSIYVCKDG